MTTNEFLQIACCVAVLAYALALAFRPVRTMADVKKLAPKGTFPEDE